jgi:hypothetical protein
MRMERRVVAACAFGALAGLAVWNYVWAYRPVAQELAQDARNDRVALCAYYRWGVAPSQVVIDLRDVSPDASTLDVLRPIFASARALQAGHFDQVVLAWRGRARFTLAGDDFRWLGELYDVQNPAYSERSFRQHVLRLDGTHVYGPRTGVLLGADIGATRREANSSLTRDGFLGALSSEPAGSDV